MNLDKAREFFSAYYDQTLEPGLRQQLESRMRADRSLAADYAAFSATMEALQSLPEEEIEIPLYLSDRIATRLEKEEARRSQSNALLGMWLRRLAFGGVAAVLLVGGFLSLKGGTGAATASLLPGAIESKTELTDQMVFEASGREVRLLYRAGGPRSVSVTAAASDRELQHFSLNGNLLDSPLKNGNPGVALLKVTATNDGTAVVALPGRIRSTEKDGTGTLNEFAAALASNYGVPVVVRATDPAPITWSFDASSAREAATKALAGHQLSVDQRTGDLITILAH